MRCADYSRNIRAHYSTCVVCDLPDHLDRGALYVVGEGGYSWSAGLLCPCGCGEAIQLNLVPPGPPLWRVRTYSDGTSTISPSIWRNIGCMSHFWIRRGRVMWVGRGEPPPPSRASESSLR